MVLKAKQQDLENFADFKSKWQMGTLEDDHVVRLKVRRRARTTAYRYKIPNLADDLEQLCLMSMSTTEYRGEASLDVFIAKILLHEIIREWQRRGGKRQTELPEEMQDRESKETLDAVLRRLSSERMMDKLLRERPDFTRAIVSIIIEAEHSIGRRRIAELASKRLRRKITRHEVEVVLKQLRNDFRPPACRVSVRR